MLVKKQLPRSFPTGAAVLNTLHYLHNSKPYGKDRIMIAEGELAEALEAVQNAVLSAFVDVGRRVPGFPALQVGEESIAVLDEDGEEVQLFDDADSAAEYLAGRLQPVITGEDG